MKEEILLRNPEFENDFRELVSGEEMKYYYHVTSINPDHILEEGLYLSEDKLTSTTIEIPEEFVISPIEYCLGEKGTEYRKNPKIILLGIPEDELDQAVLPNGEVASEWTQEEYPNYVIPTRYVIGYIDTDDFEIVLNEAYEYSDNKYTI